ncbi:MAG: VCBS repeat-containing protein [Candidatus Delongbacteria bacterium]|nr:VCBS repeat-containing protein [Candidatus Delongbacteria bacterium]MBN2836344.1 VCBS repeat-containing protein [Candidatus Delongbacteria bacterium]
MRSLSLSFLVCLLGLFTSCLDKSVSSHANTEKGNEQISLSENLAKVISGEIGTCSDQQKIFITDVNGDSKDDIVKLSDNNELVEVITYLNRGETLYESSKNINGGWSVDKDHYLADVNGDGIKDLVAVYKRDYGTGIIWFRTEVFQSYGNGFSNVSNEYTSSWVEGKKHIFGNLNFDQKEDMLEVYNTASYINYSINTSDGTRFNNHSSSTENGDFSNSFTFLSDINGDSICDVITLAKVNDNLKMYLYLLDNSQMVLSSMHTLTSCSDDMKFNFLDYNQDSKSDLIITQSKSGFLKIEIFTSNGDDLSQAHDFTISEWINNGLLDFEVKDNLLTLRHIYETNGYFKLDLYTMNDSMFEKTDECIIGEWPGKTSIRSAELDDNQENDFYIMQTKSDNFIYIKGYTYSN